MALLFSFLTKLSIIKLAKYKLPMIREICIGMFSLFMIKFFKETKKY